MCIIGEDSLCFDMQHYAVWINNAHWLYYWKRSESAVYKSVHPQYFKHSALISSSMQCYCASAALYGQKIANAHARLCIDSSASAAALLEKITVQCTASTRSVSIIGEDYYAVHCINEVCQHYWRRLQGWRRQPRSFLTAVTSPHTHL